MSSRPIASDFTVYPAIDVRDGRVVRLAQGDYARETHYRDDPFTLACEYASADASWLHLVDLDAARVGKSNLHALIDRIADATSLRIQAGGGVRSSHDVDALLAAGAARAVIGTLAVTHTPQVIEWISRYGSERLCIAIDVRRDAGGCWRAATHGWTSTQGVDALALIERLAEDGLRHLLSTDIGRDGMLCGPALDWYAELAARVPSVAVQGSGGIGALTDIDALRRAGCRGAIVGRALLEGRFGIEEALAC